MYADTFKFIIVIFLIFFPSGKIILDLLNLKATPWEKLLLSVNLGTVFVTICAFLLGFLGNTKIILVLIWLPFLYLVITQGRHFIAIFKDNFLKVDLILVLVLFFSVLVQSIITFPSGDITDKGLKLVGIHSSDSIWYIALINSLEKSIPPQNPIFSGTILQNYHYFTFIFASLIKSVTSIPAMVFYFKLFLPFLTLLFSATVFLFVNSLTGSKWTGYLAVLITTLGSNLYYLVDYMYPNATLTPSVFWVDEYTTRMVNPQLLISYIILISALFLLLNIKKVSEYKFIVIFSLLIGSLLGFKSFATAVFLPALIILMLLRILKKDFSYIKLFIGISIATAVSYLSLIKIYTSFFIFSPFWLIKTMLESSDHLNFSEWELKRQTYLSQGNILRVIQLYLEGILVFLAGNLGIRLIGFLSFFQGYSGRKKEIILLILFMGVVGFILTMLTISKGITWNSVQFFYYTVMFSAILTTVAVGSIFKRNALIGIMLFGFIWLPLLPGVIFTTKNYLSAADNFFLQPDLLLAMDYLNKKEDGVVLINPKLASTSIVPALSKKSAFFADETQLVITGVDFTKRKRETELFFNNKLDNPKKWLDENRIKYIFTDVQIPENEYPGIQRIFKNKTIIIYQR